MAVTVAPVAHVVQLLSPAVYSTAGVRSAIGRWCTHLQRVDHDDSCHSVGVPCRQLCCRWPVALCDTGHDPARKIVTLLHARDTCAAVGTRTLKVTITTGASAFVALRSSAMSFAAVVAGTPVSGGA